MNAIAVPCALGRFSYKKEMVLRTCVDPHTVYLVSGKKKKSDLNLLPVLCHSSNRHFSTLSPLKLIYLDFISLGFCIMNYHTIL